MFTTSITWWKEQMRDLVPASLRFSSQTWRRALVVVANKSDDATADLLLLGRGGEEPARRRPFLD
jgi:hypothetical protein